MKGNRLHRVISFAMILLLFLNLAVPISAASSVNFSLNSKKYENGTFMATTDFAAGDDVYISVDAGNIPSIGGITLVLNYNKKLFTFKEKASFCVISDEKGEVTFNDIGGKVITVWETTSSKTQSFQGPMFYLVFSVVSELSDDAKGDFSLSVTELFDGSNSQNNIDFTVGNAISVNIKLAVVPEATLKLFEALKNITYSKESLDAIVKAEEAYAGLTSKQQETLKNKYSALHGYFTTARQRYYKLAEQAGLEAILQEIKNYESKHAAVLVLTEETVKLSDEAAVESAIKDLEAMSSIAKSRFDEKKATLIQSLKNRIEQLKEEASALEEVKTEVKEFKETYAQLFKGDIEEYLEISSELYSPLVSEALLVYSIMSDGAKNLLKNEYSKLKDLEGKLAVINANNAREREINELITAFQQQYIQVFKINSANVTVEDETAIKMVLEAYKRLTDEDVKERLSSKMQSLENFLKIIEGLKNAQSDSDQTTPSQGTSSGSSQTNTDGTKVETVVKEVENTKLLETGFSTYLWIMLILLSLAILLAIAAFYIHFLTQKQNVYEEE